MLEKENKGGRPKSGENPFTEIFKKLVGEDVTQQEIADKIGVTRQNVGKWLSGITTPDIVTLVKIADAYGVSTDYLLGRTEIKTADIEIQAICDYTGLSERAINTLAKEFTLSCPYQQQNKKLTKSCPYQQQDKNLTKELKKRTEVANQIIEEGFLFNLAVEAAKLIERSEYVSRYFFYLRLENNVLATNRLASEFNVNVSSLLGLVRKKAEEINKSEPNLKDSGSRIMTLSRDKDCDLRRYNLLRCCEEMSNTFDRRNDWQNYNREQLLKCLGITEEELKELQARSEQEANSGKHNEETE